MIPITPAGNPKRRSISTGVNIVTYALLILSVSVTCFMMFVMTPRVQRINRVRTLSAQAENQLSRIAYLSSKSSSSVDADREEIKNELNSEVNAFNNTLSSLSYQLPPSLSVAHAQLAQGVTNWQTVSRLINEFAEQRAPQDKRQIAELESRIKVVLNSLSECTAVLSRYTEEVSEFSNVISTGVYIINILMIAWILLLLRSITQRLHHLHSVTQRVGQGDYEAKAIPTGNDELTSLAEAFNSMTVQVSQRLSSERQARQQMEQLIKTLSETAERLATSASDILTATTEQAAAMSEEAAAVQQTSVTVEELKQVTALSTQKANLVATLAQQSEEVTNCGREAVERSVEGMMKIREEVQSLATSMQRLSEQTQQVGEIVSSVQDIAEQSNMLAVNAAIEAARAGEHGYGFSVVANEVRVLAEQSRQATVQVRSILGEIQKAVTTALSNTETESKSVEEGVKLVNQAGEVIRSLTDTISHSSNAANQIRASSDQHAAGVDQIAIAITAIRDASVQALDNTHQTEQQAKMLRNLSFNLNDILKNSKSANPDANGSDDLNALV